MARIRIGGTMQKAPVLPKYLYSEDFELPEACHRFLEDGETAIKIRITKDTLNRAQSIADVLMNLRGIAKDDSLINAKHVHVALINTMDAGLGIEKRDERVIIGEVQGRHQDWRDQASSDAHIVALTAETKIRKDIAPLPYTPEELAAPVEEALADWEQKRSVLPEPNPDLRDQYERRYKVTMDMLNAAEDPLLITRFFERLGFVGMNLLHSLTLEAVKSGDVNFSAAFSGLGGSENGGAVAAAGKNGKAK